MRLVFNDNWMDDQPRRRRYWPTVLPNEQQRIRRLTTLPPGAFTAILAGKGGGIGVGLIEVTTCNSNAKDRNVTGDESRAQPAGSKDRWKFIRDVVVFQLKMLLDNGRDLVLMPVALEARAFRSPRKSRSISAATKATGINTRSRPLSSNILS